MRQMKIVSLLVKDYDAAIQFYTQKLGFEVIEDAPFGDYQTLKARGVTFHGEPQTGPWGTGVPLEDLYGNKLLLSQEG